MNTRPDFALNPMAALVVAYNTVADVLSHTNVNKFSDKATAVKRLNAIIDQAEADGLTMVFAPNGAILQLVRASESQKLEEAHAASNQLIADAVASNPELAAMVKVEAPAETPKTESTVGGLTTLELTHRIEVLVENPKRKGSRARTVFDLYRTGQTGEEFVAAVIAAGMDRRVALSNLHWDIDHGFVYLGADAGQPRK